MTAPNARVKKVRVVATGGTIAGIGPDRLDYTLYPELGEHLTIEQSLARIPELAEIAPVQGEDLISVGSTAIGPQDWLRLAQRINVLLTEDDTLGVVVTHGTATLEETAYFLHLTVKSSDKPVVITGAMRPPTSLGTDADLNLLDAVHIAACPEAAGKGVLTVLNNEIQCARDVVKTNTLRVETFKPNELGFLGYADSDGEVVFYRAPLRKHTADTIFDVAGYDVLPRVDIVYSYAGADELLVDAVRRNRSRRAGVGRVRGRQLPAPGNRGDSPGGGRGHSGGAVLPLHRRAGCDDAPERSAALYSLRQSGTTESQGAADARAYGYRRYKGDSRNVSGILASQ